MEAADDTRDTSKTGARAPVAEARGHGTGPTPGEAGDRPSGRTPLRSSPPSTGACWRRGR
jgi:hypothetical protein